MPTLRCPPAGHRPPAAELAAHRPRRQLSACGGIPFGGTTCLGYVVLFAEKWLNHFCKLLPATSFGACCPKRTVGDFVITLGHVPRKYVLPTLAICLPGLRDGAEAGTVELHPTNRTGRLQSEDICNVPENYCDPNRLAGPFLGSMVFLGIRVPGHVIPFSPFHQTRHEATH